ncbi:MAG: SAM-dependent methyltransferase [Acidobacteria bacterium]|nr:MAG: SAM-dependent methyltransferase [Acidobacteriota bacterium]
MSALLQHTARRLFFSSLRKLQDGHLELVCPDETYTFGDPTSKLRAMAVIHDQRFFVRAITGADVGMGESFMDGDWTSPDLVSLVRLAVRNMRLLDSGHPLVSSLRSFLSRMRHRLHANSLRGSRNNIHHHYDLGNDFYALFLDQRMLYSCGLFLGENDSLETAQLHKLDLICRKLQLQPGDRVLEIGCGWGSFAVYAAQHYGVHVTGLTLSPAQHKFATRLVNESSFPTGSVRILLEDYRRISGLYDKIVSIEMFEAVGIKRYDEFFGACDRLLTPDGTMMLQTITLLDQELRSYRKRVDWIQTYIFPGSELASLAEIHRSLARRTRLSLIQMENFGLHYANTLASWRERFFQNLEQVQHLGFDARFERMWDFYLAWCEGAFLERYINVAQILLAKNGTQRPLYRDPSKIATPLARSARV